MQPSHWPQAYLSQKSYTHFTFYFYFTENAFSLHSYFHKCQTTRNFDNNHKSCYSVLLSSQNLHIFPFLLLFLLISTRFQYWAISRFVASCNTHRVYRTGFRKTRKSSLDYLQVGFSLLKALERGKRINDNNIHLADKYRLLKIQPKRGRIIKTSSRKWKQVGILLLFLFLKIKCVAKKKEQKCSLRLMSFHLGKWINLSFLPLVMYHCYWKKWNSQLTLYKRMTSDTCGTDAFCFQFKQPSSSILSQTDILIKKLTNSSS